MIGDDSIGLKDIIVETPRCAIGKIRAGVLPDSWHERHIWCHALALFNILSISLTLRCHSVILGILPVRSAYDFLDKAVVIIRLLQKREMVEVTTVSGETI